MKNVIIRIDNSKNFITVMRICEQENIKWCNDKEPIDFYPQFVIDKTYPGYIEVKDNIIGWLFGVPDEFITTEMFYSEVKGSIKETIKDELIKKLEEQVELLTETITQLTTIPHLTTRQNDSLIKKIDSLKKTLK